MAFSNALRALRHRNYRLYFWGQMVSTIGTWMQLMAQTWLVYRLTGSAWMLGLIGFASQIPALLIGVFGGVAADHFHRRTVLLWTQTAALLQALALGVLTVTGAVRVWEVFALSVLGGVINVFDMPARQALIVELVDREDLSNGIAVNTFMINASRLIGPALAGMLVSAWGEGPVFLINAASYSASIGTIALLRLAAPSACPAPTLGQAWAHVLDGLRYAAADPRMRAILRLLTALSFFGVPYMALMPIFSDRLGLGAAGVGWLMAASGVGAAAASLQMAARPSLQGLPRFVGAAAVAFGLGLAGFAACLTLSASLAAMVLVGWGMMTVFVGCNTLLQSMTSDRMRGRVMSLFSMTFMGVTPLGNLISGWAAERIGAPATVAAGAALCILAAAAFWRRRPQAPSAAGALAAVALLIVFVPASARALPLTWEECVALALRNNPDIASARSANQSQRASYRGSFNGLMPSLTLSNSYTDSSSNASGRRYGAQFSATSELLSADRIANVKSASAAYAQTQASVRSASAALRLSLRQAFSQMLFAERSLEVSRDIRDMRERGARLVALRYDSGRESKGNMLRAKAQLAQAQAELNQAARSVRVSQKILDRQLGLDDFEAVTVTGTLTALPPPPPPADEAALLARRPDVALRQAAVESARAAVSSARGGYFPALSGNYTRGRSGAAEFPSSGYSWSGGLTLSLPLFSGGPTSAYYAVKAANLSLEQARQELRAARNAAIGDLESVWSAYAGSVDQVAVQKALLEAARQRNEEADVRYASGLLTYDNWEIIASDRINTERQVVSSELNAVVAQAAWEKAIGKELGE